jgi:hypothetical protein
MSKILEKNRIRIYNDKGELVEERDATLEDLKEIILKELSEDYEIELDINMREGKARGRIKKKS